MIGTFDKQWPRPSGRNPCVDRIAVAEKPGFVRLFRDAAIDPTCFALACVSKRETKQAKHAA
jgi:hypothetical protein